MITPSRKLHAWRIIEHCADQTEKGFVKTLSAIREALHAERLVMGRDGEPRHLGPDYAVQLAAARSIADMVLRTRSAPLDKPETPERWTAAELWKVLKREYPERAMRAEIAVSGMQGKDRNQNIPAAAAAVPQRRC